MDQKDIELIDGWFSHIAQMADDRKTLNDAVMEDHQAALDEIKCLARECQEYIDLHYMKSESPSRLDETSESLMTEDKSIDMVDHPAHYTWLKEKCGIEVIDITRHMDFDLGNVIKYILRSGHKEEASMSPLEKQIEDLRKAQWYLNDKIYQLTCELEENRKNMN